MGDWRQRGSVWCLESGGAGVIEFIGGSYLATTPQLSYRRLLESLGGLGWNLRAWSYVPGFDHQAQAKDAWKAFRQERERTGTAGPVIRLGHSLGCKLHLLAPDSGRGCAGLVALAFNNFSAERSVPLLAEVGQQFGFRSEFSPSPAETLRLVSAGHRLSANLLVRFQRDSLDQSPDLLAALQQRPGDASALITLPGDHLTPASAGLRRSLLGSWADDPSRQRQIDRLASTLIDWISAGLPNQRLYHN